MVVDTSAISAILFGEDEGQAFLQAELAFDAWRRYGKGRHAAGLNLGECAAYELTRPTGEPLLNKGEDFSKTDVARAVYPV